jgi:two-component system cell cycle response regulator CpdR
MEALVVEDNPIVQTGISRALEYAGFTVTAFNDAISAFAELERRLYDVIVCDIKLPFVDGMQFYRQLAETHPTMTHRVIFVTAMVNDPEVSAFLQKIGRPALGKPFELAELVRLARAAAEEAQRAEEPVLGLVGPDRTAARRLPDEFLQMSGAPLERLTALVARYWGSAPESEQRQLEQMLLVVLEPLTREGNVTQKLREACENAVMGWAARQ